ncbi:alpha/beta hydrolase [Solimonas soli]|uniref:alpha/beta hydrolase n=1 Tax=Solimonas soli TaxID=413479 RepID=UPI000484B452|nr:alpha/beta hydrolase [Solimonas soli]
MRHRIRIVTALVAALLATACTTHLGKPDTAAAPRLKTDYSVVRDVLVSPADWPQPLPADIYRPCGDGPYPAVLVLYGGGWRAGDRTQLAAVARTLAAHGYVAVAASYRLAPRYTFPAQLRDVQLAVRWMRAHASDHAIDARRIGAWGYSAGAHLAALLGGIGPGDALYEPGTRIAAVVAGGTPTDLTQFAGGTLVPQFIGGRFEEKSAAFRAASPVSHVSADDPPVFLYHGGVDRLVPLQQARAYHALLDEAQVPNELMILRGRGHYTAFFSDGAAVDAALDFLDRHLRDAAITVRP